MPWFYLDDGFHAHEKTGHALAQKGGREAIGLWALCASWCASQLNGGQVPRWKIEQLGYREAHAKVLVVAKLWREAGDGFEFVNWHKRNPKKEDIEKAREANRVRQERFRKNQRGAPANGVSRASPNGVSHRRNNGVSHAGSDPIRSDPDQGRTRVEDLNADPRARTRESGDSRLVLDPDSDGKAERAGALLERFERVVHRGKRVADRERCLSLLGDMLPALADRASDDPVGLFERVLTAYNADRRLRSKTPTVELFARDFAQWAEREIEHANAPADRAERIHDLLEAHAEAQQRLSSAGDDAGERAAAGIALAEVERELVSLGVSPPDLGAGP